MPSSEVHRPVEIKNSNLQTMAVVSDGKMYLVADGTRPEDVKTLLVAVVGWSGALKLAMHCLPELMVAIGTLLESGSDFAQAYRDARARNPEFTAGEARWLVMPYWLLRIPEFKELNDLDQQRITEWLDPPNSTERGALSRADLLALAMMGFVHEGETVHENAGVSLGL